MIGSFVISLLLTRCNFAIFSAISKNTFGDRTVSLVSVTPGTNSYASPLLKVACNLGAKFSLCRSIIFLKKRNESISNYHVMRTYFVSAALSINKSVFLPYTRTRTTSSSLGPSWHFISLFVIPSVKSWICQKNNKVRLWY